MLARYLNQFVTHAQRVGFTLFIAVGSNISYLDVDGSVMPFISLDSPITGLGAGSDNTLIVATAREVFKYDLDNRTRVKLYNSPATIANVKIAELNGVVALVEPRKFTLLIPGKTPFIRVEASSTTLTDVCIDETYVYVVGWNNRRNGLPVRIALFRAYTYTEPTVKWYGVWNYNPSTLDNDMADTMIYAIKKHGNLLFIAGESAGGNTIFRWDGRSLNRKTIISGDKYEHAYQTKSNHITYVGIIDPSKIISASVPPNDLSPVLKGKLFLTRKQNNDGNTLRARTLSVTHSNIYVGGVATASIPNRDASFIGTKAPYRGGDASFLTLDHELNRTSWVTPGHANNVIHFDENNALISTDSKCDHPTNTGTCLALSKNTYSVDF